MCRDNDQIDAVLMDLQLPVLDGYEATTQIKAFRPSLPVITQTAFTLNNERAKCLEAGADAFLTKPIDAVRLIDVLNSFIERK